MKAPIILAMALTSAILLSAQTSTVKTNSPKETVREFVKTELEGTRLTADGRLKTAHLLIKPTPARPDPIDIVSNNFEIFETTATKSVAKFDLHFLYFYGSLDPALHFQPALHVAPGNGLIREGINVQYQLVHVNEQGGPQPDAQDKKESTPAQEWKIESLPAFGTINLAAAIRYVTEKRDQTTDPAIKKSASETLVTLKKLVSDQRGIR